MKHSTTMAILAAGLLTVGACGGPSTSSPARQGDLGTGINTIDRQYGRNATDTWDAAMAAVKAFDLKVDSSPHDSLGGEIQAHRASGDKVLVKVKGLNDRTTNVSVRVEPGNRNMAEMIHEKIADKLGLKEAKSAFFGGNTCEGTYAHPLETCVEAAESAARRLDLTVTHRELHEGKALVDARDGTSTPVQFRMRKVDQGTQVTFIAGREKNDQTQDLCNRMKAEFEAAVESKSN